MFHFFICYNLNKGVDNMAKKGQKHKKWTAEEKYKIIKPALDMEISTFQITKDTGLNNRIIKQRI